MSVERIPITDRASWLAMRQQDVTASDVAAVCGVDPYRSPLKVWAEKTGAIAFQADSATLQRGRWGEAAVIEALRDERPSWDLRRAGVYLRDPDLRLGATPDAVAIDPDRDGIGAVQCKTARRDVFERDWRVLDADARVAAAPLQYQLQTLTEAMLTGAAWATVAALVMDAGGGWEFWQAPIGRHGPAEARVRSAVAAFWAEVEAGRPPAVRHDLDGEAIHALYARPTRADPIDLSGNNRIAALLARRADLKALTKAAEAELSEIETEIKAAIGEHEAAALPGWKITWKTQQRQERLMPAWEGRVLRITEAKSKGER